MGKEEWIQSNLCLVFSESVILIELRTKKCHDDKRKWLEYTVHNSDVYKTFHAEWPNSKDFQRFYRVFIGILFYNFDNIDFRWIWGFSLFYESLPLGPKALNSYFSSLVLKWKFFIIDVKIVNLKRGHILRAKFPYRHK